MKKMRNCKIAMEKNLLDNGGGRKGRWKDEEDGVQERDCKKTSNVMSDR